MIPSKNKIALFHWRLSTEIIYPIPTKIRIIELAKISSVKGVFVIKGEIPQNIKTNASKIPNLFKCLTVIIINPQYLIIPHYIKNK